MQAKDLIVTGASRLLGKLKCLGDISTSGKVTATNGFEGNVVGNVSGSAGTAGAFTSAKSVTLTGDVTGSASSTGGWSIATTVKDDSHNHTATTIVPKMTKSYTGVIASANNHDNGALYCIKIVPNSYGSQWYLKYRVFANMDGISDANGHGYEESYVYVNGMRNTYASYRTWNNISNTSYRPYYYHSIYRAKEAGATTYGHVMGINLYNSYSPTNTTYKRNITFEILDYGGCTISFFDTPTKYTSIPGTGSTNYDGRTDFDGTTQGNTMSGDRNTTITYGTLDYYFRPYAGQALYRYKYVMQGEDNRIYPITVTNQADATQVAKVPTTVGLRPWKIWWYTTTTTINAGAVIGAQTLQETGYTTTAVYNFNASIPTYQMIYLKGTYNATKDLFYLYNDGSSPCTSYYTLVPNNTANITLSNYFAEGYYYVLLGASYSSANYVTLFGNHPLYYFDGTNLKEVNRIAPNWDENDSTSPSYIENRTHYRTSLGYNRTITSIEIGDLYYSYLDIDDVTYGYAFTIQGFVDTDGDSIYREIIPNTNASSVSASITINDVTTNHTFSVTQVGEHNSICYYDNNIAVKFDPESGDTEDILFDGACMVYLKTLPSGVSEESVVINNLTINVPTINEQFKYTKKIDDRYLNGNLITPGTGKNSEIFNDKQRNTASGEYSHAEGFRTTASNISAHAEGEFSTASGYASHAEGNSTTSGTYSHAEGFYTTASGSVSHTEGYYTIASGDNSHAEGYYTIASGSSSHAEGNGYANGIGSHAEGSGYTNGRYSHAEGGGDCSSIPGGSRKIYLTGVANTTSYTVNSYTLDGNRQSLIGFRLYNSTITIIGETVTNGVITGIEVNKPLVQYAINNKLFNFVGGSAATGDNAHSEGEYTLASGNDSHAEGFLTTASGQYSHVEGRNATASGEASHAEGYGTIAHSDYSHAEGGSDNSSTSLILSGEANATTYTTTSSTTYSPELLIGCKIGSSIITDITYSEQTLSSIVVDKTLSTSAISNKKYTTSGIYTTAKSSTSHAEGGGTKTSGDYSHAEGWRAYASGFASHAEGGGTTAYGDYSHAEGQWTIASGKYSHAEGGSYYASGNYSHAEGLSTKAPGNNSHAEGWNTTASGTNSHAEGYGTKAQRKSQHVFGEFNVLDTGGTNETTRGTYIEIVGKGTGSIARSNARTLDWSGNETLAGSITLGKGTSDEVTLTPAKLKQLLALL